MGSIIERRRVPEVLSADVGPTLENAARQFGTPLIVYSAKDMLANAARYQAIASPIFYAFKAFSGAPALRMYADQGLLFDASSFQEVHRAIEGEAKIPGDRIRLTSRQTQRPSRWHHYEDVNRFDYLAENKVEFTAGSIGQLRAYGEASNRTGRKHIGIRFNVDIGSGGHAHTTTGGENSPFGIYQRRDEINSLLKNYNLILDMVHVHIGSGSDPQKQKEAIAEALKIVEKYDTVHTLNMGGGFKVGRMSNEEGTDIEEMGQVIGRALRAFKRKTGRSLKIALEPGTGLVANAAYLVESIDEVETRGAGRRIVTTDGGMNISVRNALYGAPHPEIVLPQDGTQREVVEALIYGPVCETADLKTVETGKPGVPEWRPILDPHEDDLIVTTGVGAYIAEMGLHFYNSLDVPPIVFEGPNGELKLTRPRMTYQQFAQYESIPDFLRTTGMK